MSIPREYKPRAFRSPKGTWWVKGWGAMAGHRSLDLAYAEWL